ncbi:LysR family transcriptional regulator [Sphingomonas naphthae]|uniref:LysR family transcriptional regulator n=1 Tax=Sphingomonas naphthae TaxID=1813468 RepID=A0ABY7TMD1_9SPHN|nr:LysR family transcriptional regulator [Sphingomonas naphthae]WCT74168.1 LysR family transcriptional regulator [Sphingomonas naphthae]
MKMDDIIAFDAVVEHKSISRAAEALRLTQSAVTRRIQNLEDSLGVELLSRQTRPSRPTPIGLRVHEQARSALRQLEQIGQIVQEAAPPAGGMRIGIPQFLSEAIAIGAIAELGAQFPALDIRVTTATTPALLHGLQAGELDAAALVLPRLGQLPAPLTGHPLGPLPMAVVARSGDLPAASYRLSQVHDRGWVLNPGECGFRNGLRDALDAQGLPMRLNLDVAGVEVQLGLVAAGLGLGLVPAHMLPASAHRGGIAPVPIKDFELRNDLWLARPPMLGRLTQAAMALSGIIRKVL